MQRIRGGLVFKAHRLCVSRNSRLESNKEEEEAPNRQRSWTWWRPRRRARHSGGSASAGSPAQLENNYITEMCSGSEAGSYLRPIDFVYHSTLGLKVIKKKKKKNDMVHVKVWEMRVGFERWEFRVEGCGMRNEG